MHSQVPGVLPGRMLKFRIDRRIDSRLEKKNTKNIIVNTFPVFFNNEISLLGIMFYLSV